MQEQHTQRAMISLFHNLIHREVFILTIWLLSPGKDESHAEILKKVFKRLQLERDYNRFVRNNEMMERFIPEVRRRAAVLLERVRKIHEDALVIPGTPDFFLRFLKSCCTMLDDLSFAARA